MIARVTKRGIDDYIDRGVPVGSFLYAVLSNDLFEALNRADEYNIINIESICKYIRSYAPLVCYGSTKRVNEWMSMHREKPAKAQEIAEDQREGREQYFLIKE